MKICLGCEKEITRDKKRTAKRWEHQLFHNKQCQKLYFQKKRCDEKHKAMPLVTSWYDNHPPKPLEVIQREEEEQIQTNLIADRHYKPQEINIAIASRLYPQLRYLWE